MARSEDVRRDWISKSLAGVLLGALLAFECSAVFARLASGIPPPLRVQLGMWMTVPIWLTVASSVYFFGSGRRAWLWLGAVNLVLGGLVFLLRKA